MNLIPLKNGLNGRIFQSHSNRENLFYAMFYIYWDTSYFEPLGHKVVIYPVFQQMA